MAQRITGFILFAMIISATPAQAQIFWQPPDSSGLPLLGYEPGMGPPLPGATPAEQNAAIIWNMRSGLNSAALQCGFSPTLHTLPNYNTIIYNHRVELAAAYTTLGGYFKRVSKTPKAGQAALDKFGGQVYSSFSAVTAQFNFCSAAAQVGRRGVFTPRDKFVTFATENLRKFRNGLKFEGEQQFRLAKLSRQGFRYPSFSSNCWKRGAYNTGCGFWQVP